MNKKASHLSSSAASSVAAGGEVHAKHAAVADRSAAVGEVRPKKMNKKASHLSLPRVAVCEVNVVGAEELLSHQNIESSIAKTMQNVKATIPSSSRPACVEDDFVDGEVVKPGSTRFKLRIPSQKKSFDLPTAREQISVNINVEKPRTSNKRDALNLDSEQPQERVLVREAT